MDATALLLGAFTTLTGGVVATVLTYRLNLRREGRELQRQKLEALYMHATAYCTTLGSHYIPYLAAMDGRLDLNQAHDIINARTPDDARSFDNVRMLVDLYVPAAKSTLDDLLACRETLSTITAQFKNAYKIGRPDGTAYVRPLTDALARLDAVEEALKAVIRGETAGLSSWSSRRRSRIALPK